uniref:Uncharacterized protein n=1 Tax=Pithovirus LCPAC404 TaxID=2506597 RepID=A0A481ZFX2_9VIRU|nr:MAG: hypothetical protein LCPAC404_00350 [Pithovirus LCPAC404]
MIQKCEKRKIRTIELNEKFELLKDSLYYIELIFNSYSYDGLVYYSAISYYGFFNDLDKIENEIANIKQKEKQMSESHHPFKYLSRRSNRRFVSDYLWGDTPRLPEILKYRKLKNNYNSSDFSHPELCYRPSPLTNTLYFSSEEATIDLCPQLSDDVIGLINNFTGLDYVFVITDEEISGKIPRVMLRDQNVPEKKEVHGVLLNKLSKRKPRITYQTSMSKAPLSLYHHNLQVNPSLLICS